MLSSVDKDQLQKLYQLARDAGYFREIQDKLKQEVHMSLVDAKTPEEAFKVAIKAQMIPIIMSMIENKLTK